MRIAATTAVPTPVIARPSREPAWIDRTNGANAKISANEGRNAKSVAIDAPASPAGSIDSPPAFQPAMKPMNVTTRISGPGVASPIASAVNRSPVSSHPRATDSSRAQGTTA